MEENKFYQRLQESEEGRAYLALIENAAGRELDKKEGYELHHIFPKGLGGDPKGKLVSLTIAEHVEAHKLLAEIFKGKMLYAYLLMERGEQDPKVVEEARKEVGKYIKEHEIWKKGYQTKLEKEGKVWINAHTSEAEAKRRATKVRKFGGEFAHLQTEEVKEKRKASLRAKYGSTMGACHTPEAERKQQEARKKTMLEKYGSVTAPLHREEVRKKAEENKRRYYEKLGTTATAHTHTPELEAKRKVTKALKASIRDSEEYSIWFQGKENLYYHKVDGVKDFLKEKGKTLNDYRK